MKIDVKYDTCGDCKHWLTKNARENGWGKMVEVEDLIVMNLLVVTF